jgi:hypothetical protein
MTVMISPADWPDLYRVQDILARLQEDGVIRRGHWGMDALRPGLPAFVVHDDVSGVVMEALYPGTPAAVVPEPEPEPVPDPEPEPRRTIISPDPVLVTSKSAVVQSPTMAFVKESVPETEAAPKRGRGRPKK